MGYRVDVGILYDLLTFRIDGTIEETLDRAARRYDVTVEGHGAGIANRLESRGILRDDRWVPIRVRSWLQVQGRESRSAIDFDWTRRTIDYRARGETFFLRRRRVVDDVVAIPEAQHVDDAISAVLNYADGLWTPQAGGVCRTLVVRRRRREDEGPDDVAGAYRAELVPFELTVSRDQATGRPVALVDLSRFSSWARASRPARVGFGVDRRPELITTPMILGSSVTIRIA